MSLNGTGTPHSVKVGRQFSVMWTLFVLTATVCCILIYFVPFGGKDPQFELLPAPYYNGRASHVRHVLEKLVEVEQVRAKRRQATAETQRQQNIFKEYSKEKKNKMSMDVIGDYLHKNVVHAKPTLPNPGDKAVDRLRERLLQVQLQKQTERKKQNHAIKHGLEMPTEKPDVKSDEINLFGVEEGNTKVVENESSKYNNDENAADAAVDDDDDDDDDYDEDDEEDEEKEEQEEEVVKKLIKSSKQFNNHGKAMEMLHIETTSVEPVEETTVATTKYEKKSKDRKKKTDKKKSTQKVSNTVVEGESWRASNNLSKPKSHRHHKS